MVCIKLTGSPEQPMDTVGGLEEGRSQEASNDPSKTTVW